MLNFPGDLDLLRCPECAGLLTNDPGTAELRCRGCGRIYALAEGIPRFCDIKTDIHPSRAGTDPGDESSWSKWRRDNFEFCRGAMERVPRKGLAVDIGAGRGQFRRLFEAFEKCLAVDFYPYPGVDVVADITRQFPLDGDRADLVLLSNVLEHTPEPGFLLRECFRILKPGQGRLIVLVPFFIKIHQAPYDFFRYTPYALEYLLDKAGFRKTEIVPLGDLFDILDIVQTAAVRHLGKSGVRRAGRLKIKGLKKGMRFLASRARKMAKHSEGTPEYAQGYGCVASK